MQVFPTELLPTKQSLNGMALVLSSMESWEPRDTYSVSSAFGLREYAMFLSCPAINNN